MLPDLEPGSDGEIVAGNIWAVQAIYFAKQLEDMRAFQVADRLAELFQQGQLPLGPGKGCKLLQRRATTNDRLSAQERNALYVRVLGVAPGTPSDTQPNHEFHTRWLRLVVSVALFKGQQGPLIAGKLPGKPSAASAATVWRAARALAANASAHGAGLAAAVRRLSTDANALRAVLEVREIQRAFAARDMWHLIDRVASLELGGAVNVKRHWTLAQAGSSILQWLAEHTDALNKPVQLVGNLPPRVTQLIDAVQSWLAVSSVHDASAGNDSQPAGGQPAGASSIELQKFADELMQITGLRELLSRLDGPGAAQDRRPRQGLVVVFCGAAHTGKTLGAHALAATVSRDLVRVDLKQVVSQYIGETEKNLDAILSRPGHTDAVLLLDEADALFGRRTDVQDAHDRYANLDVDAVLQRLQAHQGVVILESHVIPTHADDDWKARFDRVVRFPRPLCAPA